MRCAFILSTASPTHVELLRACSSAEIGGFIAAGVAAVCLTFTLVGLIYRQINNRKVRREAAGRTTDVAAFTEGGGAISLELLKLNANPESEMAHLLDPRSTAV